MVNVRAGFFLLIALGLGTVAAMMAHGWIQDKASAGAEGQEASVTEVFVVAREIPYGKTLDESSVRKIVWPNENLPDGAILASEDIEGKITNQALLPGELLMRARLVDKLPGSRLSAIVTPNKRAITVRVNDVAGVAGFLLPGNRVDVLATRMEKRRAITHPLLQNIKVLAVDQKANPDKDEPIVVRAVTLESDLQQAALLASATEEGTIQLVLRNPEDSSTLTEEPTIAAAVAEPEQQTELVKTVKRVSPRRHKVTVIRGTQAKTIRVRG